MTLHSIPMRCYLLRHAEAVPHGAPGYPNDAERPLTEEGHAQARALAQGLKRMRLPVDAVVASPYLRATQTAAPVAKAFHLAGAVRTLAALQPEADPPATAAALADYARQEHIVLVGHEPHMSTWLSWLVVEAGTLRCVFKKAGVACVEIGRVPPSKGSGTLRWFMTPKQLMLIGKAT